VFAAIALYGNCFIRQLRRKKKRTVSKIVLFLYRRSMIFFLLYRMSMKFPCNLLNLAVSNIGGTWMLRNVMWGWKGFNWAVPYSNLRHATDCPWWFFFVILPCIARKVKWKYLGHGMIAVFEMLPNLSFTSLPTIRRYNEKVKTATVVLRIQGEDIRDEPERKLNTYWEMHVWFA